MINDIKFKPNEMLIITRLTVKREALLTCI